MAYKARRATGPRSKWNSLRAANRIPEVELERKVAEINRHRAVTKRERLVEESRLWNELFENDRVLKKSIARYPKQEVVSRLVLVDKEADDDELQPFSEYYRQFIIFKARRMARMFGKTMQRPPRYSELYYKETAPSRNNKTNAERLLKRCQDEAVSERRKLDALNDDRDGETPTVDEGLAHFPFAFDEPTTEFADRKLTSKLQKDVGRRRLARHGDSDGQPNAGLRQDSKEIPDGGAGISARPFHMPPIFAQFKSRRDRAFKKGLEAEDEGHVSPLPEVKRKASLPDIFKRRSSLKSSSSSSSDGD